VLLGDDDARRAVSAVGVKALERGNSGLDCGEVLRWPGEFPQSVLNRGRVNPRCPLYLEPKDCKTRVFQRRFCRSARFRELIRGTYERKLADCRSHLLARGLRRRWGH